MNKYKFLISSIIIAILYTYPISCKGKDKLAFGEVKDYWEKVSFTEKDLKMIVNKVKNYYIDSQHIDERISWSSAARYALSSLPSRVEIYPESYFKIRSKFLSKDGILTPGKSFKLDSSDKFVLYKIDYKELKKLKDKKEKKADEKKKSDKQIEKEVKELVKLEQDRKKALNDSWKKTKFSRKSYNRVISWIKKNIKQFSKYPDIYTEKEKKNLLPYNFKKTLVSSANGYLSSLDPHCAVLSAKRWDKQIQETKDSSFEGIGALLRGGSSSETIIENPLEGHPAVKAGLKAGDIITKVDKVSIKGYSLSKVVSLIRGPKGKPVYLTIKRKGYSKEIVIKVIREKINLKNVSSRWVRNHKGIGYIKLTGFINGSTESIISHFQDLMEQKKMRGLVLDLRNNPGGLLSEAISVADLFIDKGVIVSVKNPSKGQEKVYKAKMMDLTNVPLIVLINARSASASEIVASAIQDHKKGLVLGERSFGKASVQQLFSNSPGFMSKPDYYIKLTVSRYYAPSGRTIQVVGVQPDVKISNQEDNSFPYRFREENLWNHLGKIDFDYKSPQANAVKKYKEWVKKNGKSESYMKKMEKAAIHPDIQLQRAVDYLEAMIAK